MRRVREGQSVQITGVCGQMPVRVESPYKWWNAIQDFVARPDRPPLQNQDHYITTASWILKLLISPALVCQFGIVGVFFAWFSWDKSAIDHLVSFAVVYFFGSTESWDAQLPDLGYIILAHHVAWQRMIMEREQIDSNSSVTKPLSTWIAMMSTLMWRASWRSRNSTDIGVVFLYVGFLLIYFTAQWFMKQVWKGWLSSLSSPIYLLVIGFQFASLEILPQLLRTILEPLGFLFFLAFLIILIANCMTFLIRTFCLPVAVFFSTLSFSIASMLLHIGLLHRKGNLWIFFIAFIVGAAIDLYLLVIKWNSKVIKTQNLNLKYHINHHSSVVDSKKIFLNRGI